MARHAGRRAQSLSDSVPAKHKGHRYISLDRSHGLAVLLDNFGHVSKRVGAARRVGKFTISTYGNDDLGNLNVDDHDLGGCTGISSRHSWTC